MIRKIQEILLVFIIMLLGCGSHPEKEAYWITHPEVDHGENIWIIFKKKFECTEDLSEKYTARIAVDSKYWLYLNDSLVVFEGGTLVCPASHDALPASMFGWNCSGWSELAATFITKHH